MKNKRSNNLTNTYIHKKRFSAFTLAEVLITLGIIGIIAAIMIPSIVGHYRKRQVETKLQKFYSLMNQAIERSEIENGYKTEWEYELYTPEEFWNTYFAKYIKTTKTEYDRANDEFYVYFVDGSMVQITSNGRDYRFFVNNKNYKNAVPGRDSFMFLFHGLKDNDPRYKYIEGLGIEPYLFRWDGNRDSLFSSSAYQSCGCNEFCTNRCYCTKLIQMEGWKIPDDYPFKF